MATQSPPIVLDVARDLASGTTAERFEGAVHGAGVGVSFFLNHTPPGRSVSPHRHAYGEVFVIADGEAEFVVDGVTATARGGQVVVVPAGAVHGFRNSGDRPLEMTSIHAAAEMATEWVDDA
jgi:mannose-6-phosphate isomerase-like protein (cupin superfamily)